MSGSRKMVKRELELFHRTLDSLDDDDNSRRDPLSEQIDEEEMILDEFEDEDKKEGLSGFNVSVKNRYDIAGEARAGRRDVDDDSEDEIWIKVKRKKRTKVEGGRRADDKVSNSDLYNLLLSIEKRVVRVERMQDKLMKMSSAGGSKTPSGTCAGIIFPNASPVARFLPMKTLSDVDEFEQMLEEPDIQASFRLFVQNAELKHLMDDSLVIHFNYNGIANKLALKDYKFIQFWREAVSAGMDDFENSIKCQMRAAKSRQYTAKCLMKKRNQKEEEGG
ncbi:hypothetical protein DMENIID0001_135700 [Sergentomyia squamirostris]